jgi:hypothetical protein
VFLIISIYVLKSCARNMDEKDHFMNYFRCYLKNFVPIVNRKGMIAVNALYFLLSYISVITCMVDEERTQEKMEAVSDYMSSC